MTRSRYLLAGLGLALLPAGAAVGWHYPPPGAVVYAPPPVVGLQPCPPFVPVVPLVCPPAAPVPNPPAATPRPPKVTESPPAAEPPTVRPAGYSTPSAAGPESAPAPKPTAPPAANIPKTNLPQTPAAPKAETPKPAEPKAVEPKPAGPKPGELKIELPPLPGGADGNGKPTPPAPPLALPDIKLPELPPAGPSTSRYRPEPGVRVIPVVGSPPAGTGPRTIGFYNYTDADLELWVDGRAHRLPGRHSLALDLPTTFTLRLGTGAAETIAVPASAAGLEVVIR